jgi:broad specificity phosphatase PhoE
MRVATTFLMVRHGQSTGNLSGGTLMGGWTDLPLTEQGLKEAGALAKRVASERFPDAIFSSPLQRAVQTAAVLGRQLPKRPVVLDPALREIGCGQVDGWPTKRVEACYPGEWTRNLQQIDPDFRWPGGESYREFRQRILAWMNAMARRYPGQRLLVVTHAGVVSQLVGWLRGESAARWEPFRPRNTSVTELRWQEPYVDLVRFDDCGEGAGQATVG